MNVTKIALMVFVCVSCSSGGGGGGGDPTSSSKEIGAAGGELESADGRLKITIPEGALTESVELSIESKNLDDLPDLFSALSVSEYYDLQPDGQTFAEPLKLSVKTQVEVSAEDNKTTFPFSFLMTAKDGDVESLLNQSLEVDATSEESTKGTLSGELDHFSPLIVTKGINGDEARFTAALNGASTLIKGEASPVSVTASHSPDYTAGNIALKVLSKERMSSSGDIGDEEVSKPFGEESVVSFAGYATCTEVGESFLEIATAATKVQFSPRHGTLQVLDGFNNTMIFKYKVKCVEPDSSAAAIAEGTYDTVPNPEEVFQLIGNMFAPAVNLVNQAGSIVVSGKGGKKIHNASTGAVTYDGYDSSNSNTYYGGFTGPNSLFMFGSGGIFIRSFADNEWGFGQLVNFTSNVTDATPILNADGSVLGALAADFTMNVVERFDVSSSGTGFDQSAQNAATNAHLTGAGLTSKVVSAYSPKGEGAWLGVTDDAPTNGKLFHASASDSASPTITVIGDVGQGPRRIRCLEGTGTPCVVSNYTSGTLSIIDWPTRASAPTIRGATVTVNGPVGVNLASVGGKTLALATGFNSNKLHIVTIEASTTSVQDVSLADCTGPGHAAFIGGGTHIAVTCNTNSKLKVIKTP